MDADGFVYLSEICNWNRIRRIGASLEMVTPQSCTYSTLSPRAYFTQVTKRIVFLFQLLEAVKSSAMLQVAEEWDASGTLGEMKDTALITSSSILATRILSAENPLFWTLRQTPLIGEEII